MADLPRTAHVLTVLAVSDVERAVAFYTAALAWRVLVQVAVYAELQTHGGQRVGLYERASFAESSGVHAPPPPGGTGGGGELYLRTDDLRASIAGLLAAGARRTSARALRSWGDEVAYFLDPDGHVIAVAGPHTAEEPHGD